MNYLSAFIIGSSWFVTLPFFFSVANISKRNYSFETYIMVAPLFLGFISMLGLAIHYQFGLSLVQSYGIMAFVSPAIVFAIAYFSKAYPFTTAKEWIEYAGRIFVKHFIVIMFVMFPLIYFISCEN